MRRLNSWLGARFTHFTGTSMLTVAIALAVTQSRPIPALRAADGAGTRAEQQATLAALENAFISIADSVEPTVVTIDAIENPKGSIERRAGPSRARPFAYGPRDAAPEALPKDEEGDSSGGSGVIVREEGGSAYVLTNQHVIDGADQIRIRMRNKREYRATVVGEDELTDLAVLRFRPVQPLGARHIAQLGDSDGVRVGQYAIAIGSPLGYDSTFTKGVISAKGRDLDAVDGEKDYHGLLQTDASINPGNSGGPLVNIAGEVVGINVAIASPTGSSVGLGFAIPINTARHVMSELIAHGSVTRGFLGVSTSRENEELPLELQEFYGVENGALVENVGPNTPAAAAGLRPEDVVVGFDGYPILNYGELIDRVQNTPPGKRVELHIVRDRKPLTLSLALSAQPGTVSRRVRAAAREDVPAAVAHLDPYGLRVARDGDSAVVVRDVTPGGAADEAELSPGDTILRCGTATIRSPADWTKAVAAARPASLVLRVRKGETGYTAIVVLRP